MYDKVIKYLQDKKALTPGVVALTMAIVLGHIIAIFLLFACLRTEAGKSDLGNLTEL